MPRAWYWPQSHGRERRVAAELVVEGAVDEDADGMDHARLEQENREHRERREHEAGGEAEAGRSRSRSGT